MLFGSRGPVVAVIQLHGVIGRMGPLRSGLTLSGLAGVIERAFKMKHLKAVAISVNSPGGSPVQSSLIFKRLRALAEEKDIPILAFAEDAAASGGYWLACAGDEIFADDNSIVGSIGVVSGGFGFPELLRRIGVERRMHTAGDNKGMLDPFQPEKPEDVKRLKVLQSDIHESFIDLVRSRRGKRLKGDDDEVFSGAFWTGRRALELGLVDGIGDLRSVVRDRFGEKARLRLVQARRGFLSRRLGFRTGGGGLPTPAGWASELLAAVEERFLWNRLGL